MIHYDRTDISEETDINKKSTSKECDVCHYWYFLDNGSKFQPNVCNLCHGVLMMSINLNDLAILTIQSSAYYLLLTELVKVTL